MAAKKTAAKAVSTVSQDTPETGGISPDLETARDDARKAEVDAGLKDASGGLVEVEPEIGIDPALVKARDEALKAEQNRKTY